MVDEAWVVRRLQLVLHIIVRGMTLPTTHTAGRRGSRVRVAILKIKGSTNHWKCIAVLESQTVI